jgi:hypothetical protein
MNPGVGDVFGAFLTLRIQQTTPLFYYAVCKDEVHMDWFRTYWLDEMTRLYTMDKLVVPGFTPKPKDPPPAILEAAPPKPQLNVLTWLGDQEGRPGYSRGVCVPIKMIEAWYQHPSFGEDFRTFFDQVVQLCGAADRSEYAHTLHKRFITSFRFLVLKYSKIGSYASELIASLITEMVSPTYTCLPPSRAHPVCTSLLSDGS